jgi:hypothetical protein
MAELEVRTVFEPDHPQRADVPLERSRELLDDPRGDLLGLVGCGQHAGHRELCGQVALLPTSGREIANDRRQRPGGPVAGAAERQLHGEGVSVGAKARDLHRPADEATLPRRHEALEAGAVRGSQLLGHQQRDATADHARSRVAEEQLGRRVDVGDAPRGVARHDRVGGCVCKGAELRVVESDSRRLGGPAVHPRNLTPTRTCSRHL